MTCGAVGLMHCGSKGRGALNSISFIFRQFLQKSCQTRMHSSRMRTGRSLTVCWSLLLGGLLPGGGGLLRRGVWPGGVSAPGGSAPGGCLLRGCLFRGSTPGEVSAPRGVSAPGGGSASDMSPPLWTEYYLGHNFVAAGNNKFSAQLPLPWIILDPPL